MFIDPRNCQRIDNLIHLERSPNEFRNQLCVLMGGQTGDRVLAFPFDMPKHEWAADFLYACISNGFPQTEDQFGGFAYYTQPTMWAKRLDTDNWERIGGNPMARLRRTSGRSSLPYRHFLKGISQIVERRWAITSLKFGSRVFCLPDGKLVFAGAGFRVRDWWESQRSDS